MLAQPFQIFRLLVIEVPDRLCVRFASSDHLFDFGCCGATLSLPGFRRLQFRTSGHVTGRLTHHDAISPIEKIP
jgi:hypothetical protein